MSQPTDLAPARRNRHDALHRMHLAVHMMDKARQNCRHGSEVKGRSRHSDDERPPLTSFSFPWRRSRTSLFRSMRGGGVGRGLLHLDGFLPRSCSPD